MLSFSFKPRMTSKCFWKAATKLQRARDVPVGALLGVGQVNEELAARAFHAWAYLLEHGGPDVAHVR